MKSLCHFERGTASHNWPHKAKLKLPAFALLAASAHFWAKVERVNLVIHVLSQDGNGEIESSWLKSIERIMSICGPCSLKIQENLSFEKAPPLFLPPK